LTKQSFEKFGPDVDVDNLHLHDSNLKVLSLICTGIYKHYDDGGNGIKSSQEREFASAAYFSCFRLGSFCQ